MSAAPLLNANVATIEALDALPGLGPAKASAIVAWRQRHGPCSSLEQLAVVPGIGAATLAALEGHLWCGPVGEPAPRRSTDPSGVAPAARVSSIDINTASVDELVGLSGIALARAEAIVAERTANGAFASCAELVRVRGIGPATVANLEDHCTVSGAE